MPGLADLRHCGTLLFYRGCHGFLFQCSIPSPPPQAAKIYVFMGFHPGEPFQSVRTDNKWVRYKLLAITKRVAKGYSSGFGIKNLQTQNGICLRRLRRILHFALVFFMSRPEHPSFAATRLSGVKQLIQPHCLWTHEVKKKLQPI